MRLLVIAVLLTACQQKPTVIKQEPVNQYEKNVVLVDTRSAFDYASFHITGSVSLRSEDFSVLKNTATKKRILDPDMEQNIERLAKRGVSPLKTVILISEKKDSDENKKWRWFLGKLGVTDVALMEFAHFRELNKKMVPQAEPAAMPVWKINNAKDIIKKADVCFVGWNDSECSVN